MNWFWKGGSLIPASNVVVVDIGTGLVADSDWWLVAAPVQTTSKNTYYGAWLTDAAADVVGSNWITVNSGETVSGVPLIYGSPESWDNSHWKDDRLDRGMAAQAKAFACLSGTQS